MKILSLALPRLLSENLPGILIEHLPNYKGTFVQGESRSQGYLDYAEPQPKVHLYERCKITSNPPNRTIWFVDAQLWFADAAFCISKHPTSVKNNLHFHTFCIKMAAARQKKQVNCLFCTHLAHFFLFILAQSK